MTKSLTMPPKATVLLLVAVTSGLLAQNSSEERAAWNQPVKPFRIIGNIYYVGVSGVSSFLIETPQGAILLNGGFPETAPLIAKSISELGFILTDVKYLLNSHAHYDHCGGLSELKRRSGARMIASKGDSATLASSKDSLFPPVKVDRIIGDRETVKLGDVTLTAHLTLGHTKGCTTWTTTVSEAGKTYQVVFYCSTTVAGNQLVNNRKYPEIVTDYERSFAELRKLPCDVFLAPHGGFFHRDEKRARLLNGNLEAFVDSTELQKYVDESERSFRRELQRQEAAH
jgi:metallo-beta-lactamase class B